MYIYILGLAFSIILITFNCSTAKDQSYQTIHDILDPYANLFFGPEIIYTIHFYFPNGRLSSLSYLYITRISNIQLYIKIIIYLNIKLDIENIVISTSF